MCAYFINVIIPTWLEGISIIYLIEIKLTIYIILYIYI